MKKIFTLLVGAAMLAPMASAEEVTMTLNNQPAVGQVGPAVASMKGTVTYDASTGIYTLPNFIGYPNATVEFEVLDDLTWDFNGTTAYAIYYENSAEATAQNTVYVKNVTKMMIDFSLYSGFMGEADAVDEPVATSGVFEGPNNIKIKLHNVQGIFGNNEKTTSLAELNAAKMGFAVKQGDGYKFYIRLNYTGQSMDTGAGFGEPTRGDMYYYLSFSYPDNGGSSAITEIEAADENAPVEYFNLQGVRVDNPANGLYIRRQGNKIEKVVIR